MTSRLPEISNPQELYSAPKPPSYLRKKEVPPAEGAFRKCAEVTTDTAEILFSPRYSLFIQSLSALCAGSRGDYDFSRAYGVLGLMASPIYELLRYSVGIPVLIGSSVATATTGIPAMIERAVRSLKKKTPEEQQQIQLTKQFVQRMHETINKLPREQKKFYIKNPEAILNLSILAVAFRSRTLEGGTLKVGDKNLALEDIGKLPEHCKEYFTLVCQIRDEIANLRLSPDDPHAWNFLLNGLNQLRSSETVPAMSEHHQAVTMLTLVTYLFELTQKVTTDQVFVKVWKESRK